MSSYDAELVDEAFSSWVPEFVSEHETRGCDAYCTSHYADDSEHKMLILALMAKAEHERAEALQANVSEARAMAFNLYRDGVLRDSLGENGEPLSDIHNLLAAALNTGLEGDGEVTGVFTAMGLDEPKFPTMRKDDE